MTHGHVPQVPRPHPAPEGDSPSPGRGWPRASLFHGLWLPLAAKCPPCGQRGQRVRGQGPAQSGRGQEWGHGPGEPGTGTETTRVGTGTARIGTEIGTGRARTGDRNRNRVWDSRIYSWTPLTLPGCAGLVSTGSRPGKPPHFEMAARNRAFSCEPSLPNSETEPKLGTEIPKVRRKC